MENPHLCRKKEVTEGSPWASPTGPHRRCRPRLTFQARALSSSELWVKLWASMFFIWTSMEIYMKLWICMCTYVCIYMCVYIYIYIYICTCVYIYIYIYLYVHVYIYIFMVFAVSYKHLEDLASESICCK